MKRRFYRWLTRRYLLYDGKGAVPGLNFTIRVRLWDPLFWLWLWSGR